MCYREGKLESSQEFIVRASAYSSYDWEDVYKSRLAKARHQLKKELTKKGVKVDEKIDIIPTDSHPEEQEDQEPPEEEILEKSEN